MITSSASASVVENTPANAVIYTATATDADGDTISWSLSGADAAQLSIDAAGNVTLNAPADFENKASYSFNVVATDNGTPSLGSTKTIILSVTDVNEPPTATITFGQSRPCQEPAPTGVTIISGNTITANVSDPETPNSLSMNWDRGTTQIKFTSPTDQAPTVSLLAGASSYGEITLTVTDPGGLSSSAKKCIRVCNSGSTNCP